MRMHDNWLLLNCEDVELPRYCEINVKLPRALILNCYRRILFANNTFQADYLFSNTIFMRDKANLMVDKHR